MKRIDGIKLALWSFATTATSFGEHGAGEHQMIAAAAIAAFLTHVFAHFTADQAKEVLAGFEHEANHDLEFALAAAYREALRHVRTEIAGRVLGADFAELFDAWEDRLALVHNPGDASRFFNPSDLVDPVVIASNPNFWSNIRVVLLRSIGRSELPPELEAYLGEHLPGLIETAMERVIREGPQSRGLVAWQESFLKAIQRNGADTNQIVRGLDRKMDQLIGARPAPTQVDITLYLTALWNDTRLIDIKNLRTSDGSANTFDIDLLYTPLTTMLPHSLHARGKDQDLERMERSEVPLQEALQQPRLLLVGDPGAGKTTFLRRIAFEACHALLGKEAERHVEPILSERRFPILIRAENLASGLPAGNSHKLLFHFLDREYPEIGAAHFYEEFEKGCLLLLDGLDEIAIEALRDRTVEILKRAANKYPRTRVVATSRPGVFGGVTRIANFDSVRIAALDRPAKRVFVEKWGSAVYPADPAAAGELSRTLLSEINAKKEIRALAGNPVMLTALACLHFTHATLPEQRSELYWSVLEWLAKARSAKTGRDHNVLLALLRKLAFSMHSGQSSKRVEIERDEAIGVLAPEFQEEKGSARQREAAERFLLAEEVNSGIIVSQGETIRFWHLTFQEALSADALAYDPDERQRLIFDQDRVNDPQWRETVLLLAGELKKRGNDPVNKLLDKVLLSAEGKGLLREARCAGLMGALLKDLAAWKYTLPEPLQVRYRAILKRALSIFDTAQAGGVPLEDRVEAAEALGQAGDPRLRLPKDKDYWAPIPAGAFAMGEGEASDEPQHEVELGAFLMGRCPVTVHEYGLFLDDTEYQQPPDWEEQSEHANRPVVRVSWHDAEAYCKWAEKHYGCEGIRLPTEAQWERAARGLKGRRYAWGNWQPRPELANYDKAEVNAPSPVGLFPRGSTPEGILDMTGNVWEWVSDWYSRGYYGESEKSNPAGPKSGELKGLRGGSWGSPSTFLCAACRFGGLPDGRSDDIGFRCVREVFS